MHRGEAEDRDAAPSAMEHAANIAVIVLQPVLFGPRFRFAGALFASFVAGRRLLAPRCMV